MRTYATAFAFGVVIPQVITFLLSFGTDSLSPLIGVGPYFNFVARLCLAFGLVFELPLLVLARMMGHSSPQTTMRYVELEDHELRTYFLQALETLNTQDLFDEPEL